MSRQAKSFYEFGSFRLDPDEHLLLRDGQAVPLPPKVFDTLLLLVEQSGHTVEKDELMRQLWPDTFVEEVTLAKNIWMLRKALGEEPDGERYVETVPKRGYRFVAGVKEVLEEKADVNEAVPVAGTLTRSWFAGHRIALAATSAGLIAVVSLSGLALYSYFNRPAAGEVVRSFILPPEKSTFNFRGINAGPIAISPDGRRLAFAATTEDRRSFLWVRTLDALTAQAIEGTERASYPFWSPDSRFLAFFADGKLKRIEATGGPALTLCDAPSGRGGTWNRDDVILFSPATPGGLYRISASGGAARPVTKLNEMRGEIIHRWPYFLPDGRHFLYLAWGEGEWGAVYVGSLEKQESKLLMRERSNVAYAEGHILYLRDRTLLAQQFDAGRLETVGEAIPVAEQVQSSLIRGVFSVSENGVLAYQSGAATLGSRLVWLDRSGKSLGALGDLANHLNPELSRDGKGVAATIFNPETDRPDIWVYDVVRGLKTRFTFDPATERIAIWSPDGNRLIFNSDRKGHFDIYQKDADGVGAERLLLESNMDKHPKSWSPDGRFILYSTVDPKTKVDLWVLPMSGDRKPFPFLQTEFTEVNGQFSPDGRWIAYDSDESQRSEVYVAPFPGPGARLRISTLGGQRPRWRGDGREIFYLAPDDKLMAADVDGQGSTLKVGGVRQLFESSLIAGGAHYTVTPDGKRFLVNAPVEQKAPLPITLVLNWTAGLRR
jgi:Tol biopolymer transport system component/DNA-binding winged helix-turn-helix (wHTH) protein